MEMKDILEALDRIEAKMAATSKDNTEELKRLGEAQKKLANELLDLQQKGIRRQSDESVPSAGDAFVGTDAYKAMAAGASRSMKLELKEEQAPVDAKASSATNPITTPSGGVVQAYRRPGILPGAFRPLTIESLFPSLTITAPAFEYVQEKEADNYNGAAFVAEGAQKPFGSTNFEVKTGVVRTIAHMARISKQLMADGPALAAYINQRLVYGVDLVVEDQLVTGDGTGQNLSGIMTTGNFTAHGATLADLDDNSNILDVILFAKTKIEQAFFRPNVILLNPVNWSQMQMLKNESGNYYLGHPASTAPKYLWGLPVWTTPAIAEDKFLVGDFQAAATLWLRQGMTVELFEQDSDNVQKNLVTIRAERRLGFSVERPAALVGGDLAVPAS